MNLTQSRWLFSIMIGTGLVVGALFPLFVSLFVTINGNVPLFVISCMLAGMIVGFFHFLICKIILTKFKEIEKRNMDLCKEVSIDTLTGVLNRRALDKQITEIRNGSCVDNMSILFIDVDNFSQLNNIHGHAQGDQILAEISSIMSSNIRNTDRIFRYGGEEFLIFLPHTPKTEAYLVAEKLRNLVEESSMATISIGIAGYPEDSSYIYEAIDYADKAMLAAKSSGKNKTRIHEPNKQVS